MYTFEMTRLVDAQPDVVWDVISDHTLFGQVAPNLSKVEVVQGRGHSTQRKCTSVGGNSWTEACVLWEEGQRYAFEVDTDNPTYPLAKMRGTFGLDTRPDGVLVTMRFDYLPKFNPPLLGWLMDWLGKRSSTPLAQAIFDGWEAAIRQRQVQRRQVATGA